MNAARPLQRCVAWSGLAALAFTVAACGSGGKASAPTPGSDTTPTSSTASASDPPTAAASAPADGRTRLTVAVPAADRDRPFDTPRTLIAPAGSTVSVWARVDGARLATWTPEGDLLISTPGVGAIRLLHPQGSAPRVSTVVSGLSSPQGMAFDVLDGQRVLYVIESTQLDRYVWTGDGVGARTVVVPLPGGSGGYRHPLKNVAVGPDHTVYLDVGSSSNADPADRDNGQALVASYRPDGSGRRVLMTGVRNGDGLAFDPNGALWTAVNNRDQITFPRHAAFGGTSDGFGREFQSYVNDHPADEIAQVIAGRDLGWPLCNPDQDVSADTDPLGAMAFSRDAETNANGSALDCGALLPVERGLPAHSAPLGFHFLANSALPADWRGGAVVATHGSNGHVPPLPGAVSWLPWNGSTLGAAQDLITGFATGGGNDIDRWGRPVDAVPGPDGALYVTDDTAGAVYRVVLAS